MTTFTTYTLRALPYGVSFMMGWALIHLIFRKVPKPPLLIRMALAEGLGLGLSAWITFFTVILFDSYQRPFVILIQCIVTAALILLSLFLTDFKIRLRLNRQDLKNISLLLLMLILCMIPLWLHAKYYPMGGWDAWEVWNYKAKFIFSAEDKWTNMFQPMLWRSSPHYPLLLPLVNVWGWSFINQTTPAIPMITSMVFVFLTICLLSAVLYHSTKSPTALLVPGLLVTLPFFGILSISQYCDIVLSFYLLSSLYGLIKTLEGSHTAPYAILSGISLGMLSFTKPEGIVAAGILLLLSSILFILKHRDPTIRRTFLLPLSLSFGLSSLTTIIFLVMYSPGNQTFINGLASETSPSTIYRLKMILGFLLFEMKSAKWNGIWFFVLGGLILFYRPCLRRGIRLIPLFLLAYILTVLSYYFVNTYFEIGWWLQNTLNRILFSLLPVFLWWIFDSINANPET